MDLNTDIEINLIDPEMQTALNLQLIDAAGEGNIPHMADLLNAGAQINGFARLITALMSAASKGQLEAVIFLYMNGADLNIISLQNQNTALIYAVIDSHIDVVNFFISVGARLDCQNVYGNTAFMLGCRHKDKSIAFNLLCAIPMQEIINIQETNRYNEVVEPCKAFIIQNQQKLLEIFTIFEESNSSVKGLFMRLPIELMAKIFHESGLFGGYPYSFRLVEDISYVLNNNKAMDFLPLENKGKKRIEKDILESKNQKERKIFLPLQQGKKRKAAEASELEHKREKYQKTENGEKDTTDLIDKNKPGK